MSESREWAFAGLTELGQALRTGETTARALTEYFLDRLDTHGRKLNALVTLTRERALREADTADRELAAGHDRGPLHGIPWGAKDLLATADYPTSWGAVPFRDQQFDVDADVVRRLTEAGAVLVGKLAMVELAGGWGYEQPNAALTGPGLNAWSNDHWAGGSSSGSGAAVGAGLVPFAIGTETWGSIHSPSSFNGITGLRPTFGRVSRAGAMALSWTMDKIGPMARSAADCDLVLAAIAGDAPGDLATVGAPAYDRTAKEGKLRIGVLTAAIDGAAPLVAANARAAVEVLGEIGSLSEVALPELPWDEAASLIINCEAASAFEDFLDRNGNAELTAPEDRSGIYHALTVPAVDYLRAMRIRAEGARHMAALLADFDILVAPAYTVVAPSATGGFEQHFSMHDPVSLSAMGNLTGLPSICLPTGLGEEGLPTSIELLGPWWTERALVAAANEFQARTDYHTLRPPHWDPDA